MQHLQRIGPAAGAKGTVRAPVAMYQRDQPLPVEDFALLRACARRFIGIGTRTVAADPHLVFAGLGSPPYAEAIEEMPYTYLV